ncbi:MAG TPA: baseplate J/gp47 family protein, partial [Ktedonobacteraceae bacterium]
MPNYITLPVTVNPLALRQRAYSYLQNLMPSWIPAEGNLDTWLLEASTTEIAELVAILSAVPDIIFQYFGASLMQISQRTASAAQGSTTWYFIDSNGHTIPAGTQVAIRNNVGESIPFFTVADVAVASGSDRTDIGAVFISAINAGTEANALGGAVDLLDILDFVDHVIVEGTTSGGIDAETDRDYMNRLVDTLTLLTLTPILPEDFATLARSIPPAYRVTVLDCYNPADDTFNNPRMVTIAAIDITGEAVDTATKTNIKNKLQSVREINFIVNMMDPTYTTIDVTVTVEAVEGHDHATVLNDTTTRILSFLNPANFALTGNDLQSWENTNILRKYDLSQAIHATPGVQTIVPPLLLGKTGGTLSED